MIELVSIDDVLKGYKNVPARYYFKFLDQFECFHVGTAQELLVTKDSVRRWFAGFSPKQRAAFRDADFIQALLDTPPEFLTYENKLIVNGEYLHDGVKEPFEHAVMRIAKVHEFRDELIEDRKIQIEKLEVSTEAESVDIQERIAYIDQYLVKVNETYSPGKLARYYRGMLWYGHPSKLYEEIGGDIAHF